MQELEIGLDTFGDPHPRRRALSSIACAGLMLAIIGGEPARFASYVDLYYEALTKFGLERRAVGVHCPGHVANSDEQAREQSWPQELLGA